MLEHERDELLLVECRNTETAYMFPIGVLEYKACEVEEFPDAMFADYQDTRLLILDEPRPQSQELVRR